MLERLTDGSLRAYVDARAFARTSRHDRIDAAHLLVGMLRAPDAGGGALLGPAGLRYDDVRIVVEQAYPRVDDRRLGRIGLTPQSKRLLEIARDEARRDAHDLIDTAHLALACTHWDQLPSVRPFVAGREPIIREQAFRALRRRRPPDDLDANLAARREALARANAIRTRRARLKKDLKEGRASIGPVLLDPPDFVATAKVFDLLLALPRYGRVKVEKVLTHCRIAPSKTVGGLSQDQRAALLGLLGR